MTRSTRLIPWAWLSLALALWAQEEQTGSTPDPPRIYERIVVMGASASAGYNTSREVDVSLPLGRFLDLAIQITQQTPLDLGDEKFFLNPDFYGKNQTAKALDAKPSLVVALDFLFWYAYGRKEAETQRLEDLEIGLKHLERFSCPILISRFPDMSPAIGYMLSRAQVPKSKSLADLNHRLERWAQEHPNVHFVPMVHFLDRIRSGSAVDTEFGRWEENSAEHILQADHLHPTVEGMAALACLCLHTVMQNYPQSPTEGMETQVRALRDKVAESVGLEWKAARTYQPKPVEVPATPQGSGNADSRRGATDDFG